MMFEFAGEKLKRHPSALNVEDIDSPLVLSFLQQLESVRGNRASSRNVRLAAIKSFMRFVEYRVPSALDQVRRILAIPAKKTDSRLVAHLDLTEMQAILNAPDPATRYGIRDRAMLCLGFNAGLRVSELIGLQMSHIAWQSTPCILVHGKGRRERALPLCKESAGAIRAWLSVRGDLAVPELYVNSRGEQMTRSGFEYVLRKHVQAAVRSCPSLRTKHVSPHTLRHTCAMTLLQATHDIRKVALWLGHTSIQSTEIYTRADPVQKLEAIQAITPPSLRRGRFRPPDKLIALLRRP